MNKERKREIGASIPEEYRVQYVRDLLDESMEKGERQLKVFRSLKERIKVEPDTINHEEANRKVENNKNYILNEKLFKYLNEKNIFEKDIVGIREEKEKFIITYTDEEGNNKVKEIAKKELLNDKIKDSE